MTLNPASVPGTGERPQVSPETLERRNRLRAGHQGCGDRLLSLAGILNEAVTDYFFGFGGVARFPF